MVNENRPPLSELLSAYLDGELDAEECAFVERALHEKEEARQLLEELRRTAAVVAMLPRHDAPPSILDDLRSQVERAELLGELEDRRPVSGGWRVPVFTLSMAAMLALVAAGIWYLRDLPGARSRPSDRVVTTLSRDDDREVLRRELAEESSPKVELEGGSRRDRRAGARPQLPSLEGKAEAGFAKGTLDGARERGADATKAVSKRPHIAVGQGPNINLFATANIDQKLGTWLNVGELRQHPFANESIRVQIEAKSREQREAISAALASRLTERQAVDLAVYGDDIPANRLSRQGFFYRGRPGVNFEGAGERQILVRVPAEELQKLLVDVEKLPVTGSQVTFYSGPVGIKGLEATRQLLRDEVRDGSQTEAPGRERRVARRSGRSGRSRLGRDDATAERNERQEGALVDLAETLGIDMEVFAARSESEMGPPPDRAELSGSAESPSAQAWRDDAAPARVADERMASAAELGPGTAQRAPEAIPPTAAPATVPSTGKTAAAQTKTKVVGPEPGVDGPAPKPHMVDLFDRSTLVDRRLKELAEPPAAGATGEETTPPPDWTADESIAYSSTSSPESLATPPDQFLTVVFRLVVEPPQSRGPAGHGPSEAPQTESKPESETRVPSSRPRE